MGVRQKTPFFTTKLTLRPIISNIGTAAYEIARYLAELLAPLGNPNIPYQIQKILLLD